ncbi:MAG: DoxX family protein [Patescibacteria group bacterium]
MKKLTSFLELYSHSVLRIGLSMVILWFSSQQFLHTDAWTAYVPDSAVAVTHLSAVTLVYFNAVFELVFGIILLFGWKTRLAAFLLSLHLFDIMYVVGYGEIGVRDFGLAVATFTVFMNGPDMLCADQKKNYDNVESIKNFLPKADQPVVEKVKKFI